MVTTAERPSPDNFLASWATEHGLRMSGRWVDPEPEPVREEEAYRLPDDQPADQRRIVRRSPAHRANAMDAIAALTGIDVDLPEEIVVPVEMPYVGVTTAPVPAEAPQPSSWRVRDANWRSERGIVRKHAKLPPSKTTAGRREAHLRNLVKQGRFATIEEARAKTPRRPASTRYGRDKKRDAGSADRHRRL